MLLEYADSAVNVNATNDAGRVSRVRRPPMSVGRKLMTPLHERMRAAERVDPR